MLNRMRYAMMMALILALASIGMTAQAQYRTNDRQVRQLIRRIEDRTDRFRSSLNSALDRSRLDGTNREDNINQFVNDFEQATNRLRDNFNSRQSTTSDVQEVLNRASRIDRFMQRQGSRLDATAQNDWIALRSDLSTLASYYRVSWNWNNQNYPTYGNNDGGYNGGYASNRLTGTFRLDASRSDDARSAAERATRGLSYRDRQRVLDQVTARLESPEMLAIERRGSNVTIASSRAPQITFAADGRDRIEQTPSGRTVRARATLYGDQLTVSTTGNTGNDFTATFEPVDNGQRLRVTRRVTVEGLYQPVVVQSVYERTSNVAQWNVYTGGQNYPNYPQTGTTSGDFVVPNGTQLVAVLNDNLSTRQVREGDRFTMTVNQPSQFYGATIDGYVSNVQRSGRVTGRSQMTLNFENIRLRNGQSYRFAGIVEAVRTASGETVRVDNEGGVQESDSQTNRTVTRTAIGTAVGAIIGAIAGGGKGAAIGAAVGAGAGAGSIYAQGRDDLELTSGTEVVIRASGPR